MIKFLEDKLFLKTKDTQSDILYAQWNYDKRLIPTALQAISNLFPHYSLHDESHSISIINNIVRIIGKENIEKLSSIDIWMILEASYYHDIGMVISGESLLQTIDSDNFITFLKDLQKDKKSSLFASANLFGFDGKRIIFKNNYFNLELYEGIKFIIAEYFRRFHADRSKDIITNPLKELSLLSPRSIIPPRIFNILGEICSCHTKDFSEVLKLPFCEVGIDSEDLHPRFIACLLRIGDLLDLDNNRFSEVILRTLTKIPLDTLNHKSKHFSIENFRADRNKIEIKAKCKDYNTANITQHWFNYLNSEISNQMIKWNDIVPDKELGYLPTVGDLKVELLEYEPIDGKNKPNFSIDSDKALSLLQGAALYDGAYQCIREILQNSVDATLIRIWLEYRDTKNFDSPHNSDFIELLKNYPISVKIYSNGSQGINQRWKIIIEDYGTGISKSDLNFLMNTASSSKNKERISIIESMPLWMRPSGTFGIGFQSIFMLTDVVNIETKSFFDEQLLFIELNSPNSGKDGDILIQRKASTHAIKPGLKLTIDYKTKAIPDGYSIDSEHRNASRIAHNYDPFSHESLDIELGKIFDEVLNFSSKCCFPIELTFENEKTDHKSLIDKKFEYFVPKNSLELSVHTNTERSHYRVFTYYKNQEAKNNLRFDFLGFSININQENASEVLFLNRNQIKPDFQNKLFSQILESSFTILTENFDEIFKSDEDKEVGSMYLHFYSEYDAVKTFDISQFNHWEKSKKQIDGLGYEMKRLLTDFNTLKLQYDNNYTFPFDETYTITDKTLEIMIHGFPSFDYTKFLLFKVQDFFKFKQKSPDSITGITEVIFTKDNQNTSFGETEIIEIVKKHLVGNPHSARTFMPCSELYSNLRIKENSWISYVNQYSIDNNIHILFPKMLSPFVREEQDDGTKVLRLILNDKLIDWVYENRYDNVTTREQIKEAYENFIKLIDLDEINKLGPF